MSAAVARPVVLALVGTDHHPFDRLVDWVDDAALRHPELRFVVQHGAGKAPLVAEGHAFVPHDWLRATMRDCVAVICHGGPGTIMDARAVGHVPICVPRDPRLGEHVDGHQMRFAAMVGRAGVVRTVEGATGFQVAIDEAVAAGAAPERLRPVVESAETVAARAALAAELDLLLSVPRRPWRPARTGRAGRWGRGGVVLP